MGWRPAFLEHDFSGVARCDSIPRAVPAPASAVVPVSDEPFFFEDVQGSNLHQCAECKVNFSTRVGIFLHKTKVHGYMSPTNVHFKGNTCPRCKSIFSSEKSANDHYRRNLKRKSCARPRGTGSFKTTSAESAQEQRKKRRKKDRHAANAFWSLWIRDSRRSREERSLAHSGRGTNSRGGRGAGSKSLPKSEPRKGQTPSNGPAKSDIGSWFAKRAFSNQPGQGGPAATSHHREAEQASCHLQRQGGGASVTMAWAVVCWGLWS